jgi:predicted 3-demethylubiquinone-9 3-methyltransferase (glyoxalase superfamily)
MVQKVVPILMFKEGAREAAEFYVSIFPDGKILQGDWPGVAFEVGGQRFNAFDGGPHFSFTEGVSFIITCETQEEVDHYWNRLLEGGGKESMCGWLTDRFGVSWQVTPITLARLVADPDPDRAERTRQAMYGMRKLDIAALEAAADGNQT